jgi:hypothetical protein
MLAEKTFHCGVGREATAERNEREQVQERGG